MSDNPPQLSGALGVALTVRFLLELGLLVGAAFVTWRFIGGWVGVVAAVVAVVAVAVAWGLFLSPKASVKLPEPLKVLIELVLFVAVGGALIALGWWLIGMLGIAVWAIDRAAIAHLQRTQH